ncbi:MAG: type II toxin-antitoxin system HigB family toxin [Gemmataceae bacterium]
MHVISRKKLVDFWTRQGDAKTALAAWFRVARRARWEQWADVQRTYPKASYFNCCLVFNIGGNRYRLVVRRSANWKTLFVVGVYTHPEYDQGAWKAFCVCR